MILQELCDLADREELLDDPDFEMRPVSWVVRVGRGGELVGIEDARSPLEQKGKKAPRFVGKAMRVPRQPGRTSGDRAFFLCDKAEYALGVEPGPAELRSRPAAKLAARFGLFREQVHACAHATSDEGVQAVAALLDRVAAGEASFTVPEAVAPNDLFAFVYAPDVDRTVQERPAVRNFWKSLRATGDDEAGGTLRCLVTGEPIGAPGNFPQLKNVPGANSSGAALVSFNAGGFESHGWKGNENAAISRAAAEKAATALNRLLHPAFPDPRPASLGQPLPRRNVRLSGETVVCFWTSDAGSDDFADTFWSALDEPDPQRVGDLLRSPQSGRPTTVDAGRFYALVLGGAQGRVMIRDWYETAVDDAARGLAAYFDDLRVVRNTPPPKGKTLPHFFPLNRLLGALAPPGRGGEPPAALAAGMLRAALNSQVRFPVAVLQKAVERARAEIGRTTWADLERRDARAALIRAVLRRTPSHSEITPDMDPTNRNPGYLLGRLMAVLERLQQTALGNVNATLVDRFFGSASAAPQAVFPRLLKNARHHARKAGDGENARTARWLEGQIDAIIAQMEVRDDHAYGYQGFPPYLDLEQQGLFVLGYHQMRHWLWLPKEQREPAAEPVPA